MLVARYTNHEAIWVKYPSEFISSHIKAMHLYACSRMQLLIVHVVKLPCFQGGDNGQEDSVEKEKKEDLKKKQI